MKKLLITLLIALAGASVYGQLDTINIGTAANNGTGESLRSAMIKTNRAINMLNTIQLYNITAAELTVLNNVPATLTGTELGYVDGVTSAIQTQLNTKQATLESGTNIKTINSQTVLGSGNLEIGTGGTMDYPGAGIALSTGSAWTTSITNNSANWNTAYGWGDWSAAVGLKLSIADSLNMLLHYARKASPTFTGTVSGITSAMVGLGNVTNESKATMFASPTFTGTVSGVTATMVGLGNVTNESKTTMFASPLFSGTYARIGSDTLATRAYSRAAGGGSGGMVYPGDGIALASGGAWGTSIANNSANWNTAYNWGNHASAGYAAVGQTMYIGTTAVTINRASNALTLAGITLTTPDIGTPSAGTLTNCTFPTLNQSTTGSAATLTTARTIGGVSFNGSANITVASATGGFTISGGDLALGANNVTMSGSLGLTGTRLTKGWFTNLEITNLPTINGGTLATALSLSSYAPLASPTFTGTVTGTFSGNLTGNVTGNVTGSAGTVTGFTPASGSLTLSGADAIMLTTTAATSVTLPTSGTLATTSDLSDYLLAADTASLDARITDLEAEMVDTVNVETLLDIELSTDTVADLSELRALETAVYDTISFQTEELSDLVPMLADTTAIFVFGGGGGNAGDTAWFTTSTIYGSFYNAGSDTLKVSELRVIMLGDATDTLSVDILWDVNLNDGTPTELNTNPLPVNSFTTGDTDTSFATAKIPPGVWVWCETPGVVVGRKPTYLNAQISGYKIPRY